MCSWSVTRSVAGAFMALLLAAGHASAHAYVERSTPADRSTLREPPTDVSIRFTESVELAFSRIVVRSPAGEIVSTGVVQQLADNTLALSLKRLDPGTYTIEWRVLSVDSHVTHGVLKFTVKPGPPRGSP